MAAVTLWKPGSKRRVAQIRWKRRELIHAAVVAVLLLAFSFWAGVWIATHPLN